MRARRHRLLQLAVTQAGFFSSAQALAIGYSHQGQKYHADRGNWRRVGRGLFRLPEWPVGEHDDLHRWSVWSRGQGVLSHRSAARLHGLPAPPGDVVELIVPRSFRAVAPQVVAPQAGALQAGAPQAGALQRVRLHRPGARGGLVELSDDEIEVVAGLRVTTRARTLRDLAAELADEVPEPRRTQLEAPETDGWRQW